MVDFLLIILGALCLLVGLVGCIVPMLPGPPVTYVGILLLHLTDKVQFSTRQLLIWLIAVVLVQVLDYFIPLLGTKKLGGTRWGTWGCLLGMIAGLFFPPWGIIIGPFAGAVAGELLGGKQTNQALRAGVGAFLGFIVGTIAKFIVCGWLTYCFISALF